MDYSDISEPLMKLVNSGNAGDIVPAVFGEVEYFVIHVIPPVARVGASNALDCIHLSLWKTKYRRFHNPLHNKLRKYQNLHRKVEKLDTLFHPSEPFLSVATSSHPPAKLLHMDNPIAVLR